MGPPFWIGVDADQDWINPGFVLVSMLKRVDKAVYLTVQLVLDGKFRQVVADTHGYLTLGIGTTVAGISVEGIQASTMDNLDEFIQMGVNAEQLTGKKVLPMTPDEIKAKVKAMRDSLPSWIWDAEAQLDAAIRADPTLVPLAFTQADVDHWRAILG
jgi:basic membrane protein A